MRLPFTLIKGGSMLGRGISRKHFTPKTRGNTSFYKFTPAGAIAFLYAFCLSPLSVPLMLFCFGPKGDRRVLFDCICAGKLEIIETISANLLQGFIIKFRKEDLHLLCPSAWSGIFVKFSLQGRESKELQKMSNLCALPPSVLYTEPERRHISQIFLNSEKTFELKLGEVFVSDANQRAHKIPVEFSLNLPIVTINFDMNLMLTIPEERLNTRFAEPILKPLSVENIFCQYVSFSPLATGDDFISILNSFEHNPEFVQKAKRHFHQLENHLQTLALDSDLYFRFWKLKVLSTALGYAIGDFHSRSAISYILNGKKLFKIIQHKDFHFRNIMGEFNPESLDLTCKINLIDNSDFSDCFNSDGFIDITKTKPLGYDIFYLIFTALHKSAAIHIRHYVNEYQIRARGKQIMSATDFMYIVIKNFFLGYLQAWPESEASLFHIFTSHTWLTAPVVYGRKHMSLAPNWKHYNYLRDNVLPEAVRIYHSMSKMELR